MPGSRTALLFAEPPPPASPVGDTVPSLTPHAVSVSLPTWRDNVDYEEGAPRIKQAMRSGYPRFYIHYLIQKLAAITQARLGRPDELCILLPSQRTAEACVAFIASQDPVVPTRIVPFPVSAAAAASASASTAAGRVVTVFACFFPAESFPLAKLFWQHTGDGISSRVAERCLVLLGETDDSPAATTPPRSTTPLAAPSANDSTASGPVGRYATKVKRYATSSASLATAALTSARSATSRYSTASRSTPDDEPTSSSLASSVESLPPRPIEQDEDVLSRYVEERYGRNLDLSLAPLAKLAMRRRIAGVLREGPGQAGPVEKQDDAQVKSSDRGVEGLEEDDVWLYPCGMSAIWHAHQLAMGARLAEGEQVGKAVCFGFPYTDTLKILEKWGPGCYFLGHGLATDLPALRTLAEAASPPLLAVFAEFPSNPLLRSPPLHELRKLADEFGFLVVVDETIAGFVNVETLPLADIVVSSLTKVFSGDCNVMGGSLVINPKSKHYAALKKTQEATYEDHYFDEDAIYMERNSRDFQARVAQMNANTEFICDFLRGRRAPGPNPAGMIDPPSTPAVPGAVIKNVYYPKYMTPEHYLASLRPEDPELPHSSGFGTLFSVTFTSSLASRTFFDALGCYKGPSLGTNFTIASPYTILAHYGEIDWAKEWGVEMGLVRISVGLEKRELLLEWMEAAVQAAEKAVRDALA